MFCWPVIYYLMDVIDLDVLTKSSLASGTSLTPSLFAPGGGGGGIFFIFTILWCKCIMQSRKSCSFLVNLKIFSFSFLLEIEAFSVTILFYLDRDVYVYLISM